MPVRTCSMEPRSPLCHRVHAPRIAAPVVASAALLIPRSKAPTVTLCCQPNLRCQPDLRAASRPN
eukprot:scaffold97996_cov68-Phaeocystis_antarctica.AAC.1